MMTPLLSEHESLRIMSSVQHWMRLYFIEGTILSPRALRMTYTVSVLKKLMVLKIDTAGIYYAIY